MATPTPPPTRQQLDDLDALLQRMLALPVNPADEPAPPDPPVPYPEPLPPPAGNVVLDDPAPPIAPPPVRLGSADLPVGAASRAAPEEPASARRVYLVDAASRAAAPAAVPLPLLNPVPPAERRPPTLPPPDRPRSPRQALIASRPPGEPLLLRPVLRLNRLFDALALGLGAPGRWLRRPAGRTLLGLAGLALLAAAVALVLLDRGGWVR
jgi:hypothetical protein